MKHFNDPSLPEYLKGCSSDDELALQLSKTQGKIGYFNFKHKVKGYPHMTVVGTAHFLNSSPELLELIKESIREFEEDFTHLFPLPVAAPDEMIDVRKLP